MQFLENFGRIFSFILISSTLSVIFADIVIVLSICWTILLFVKRLANVSHLLDAIIVNNLCYLGFEVNSYTAYNPDLFIWSNFIKYFFFEWNFIMAASQHQNGAAESLIKFSKGVIKSFLRSYGDTKLTLNEMFTLLWETANVVLSLIHI